MERKAVAAPFQLEEQVEASTDFDTSSVGQGSIRSGVGLVKSENWHGSSRRASQGFATRRRGEQNRELRVARRNIGAPSAGGDAMKTERPTLTEDEKAEIEYQAKLQRIRELEQSEPSSK